MSDKKEKNTFWEWFILNRRFTIILSIIILVMGTYSIMAIPKESNPDVDIPIVVINTAFPGANPMDVEELVTQTIEDKVSSIDEINEISSISQSGISSIVVEFNADANTEEKLQEVKDEIDKVKGDLPDDAMDPNISDVNFNNEPVLRLSLSGPFDVALLKEWGDELSDKLEKIKGVSEVEVLGGQEREIQVIVNKVSLDNYALSLLQVTNGIAAANSDIPIGTIETAGENYSLSFSGRIEELAELKNIPLANIGGNIVYVEDVADVLDTYVEASTLARFSRDGAEPLQAVSVNVKRSSGGNILKIVDNSFLIVEEFKQEVPENLSFDVIEDLSDEVRTDIYDLSVSGLQTIFIVVLVLLLFVGWRGSLLAAISIPLTFFISFATLLQIGYTINMLTLFSLILSLGILVDSTIVITEGMADHMRQGKNSWEAAIASVRQYRTSLISGTMTTVFVFIPMLFSSGIIGKFIRSIPVTVSITLFSSLFVALGIVSALGARWMKSDSEEGMKGFKFIDKTINKILNFYGNFIKKLFDSRKLRKTFIGTILGISLLSISLLATGVLPVNMFPVADENSFALNISGSYGTPLETTSETVKDIEEVLIKNKNIESIQTNIGSAYSASMSGASVSSGEHLAYIVVDLYEEREDSSKAVAAQVRSAIAELDLGTWDVQVEEDSAGPATGAPVEVKISGKNLADLENVSRSIENILAKVDNVINIDSTVEPTNGEFRLYIDRVKAKSYGLAANDIAMELRNAVTGLDATTLRKDGDEVDVLVKYALGSDPNASNKATLSSIEGLTILTSQGEMPLSSFVKTSIGYNRAYIGHSATERFEKVSASVSGDIQALDVNKILEKSLARMDLPDGITYSIGGEEDDINQSFSDMGRAMIIGILAIFLLLVFQFNSYRQPFFVVITIPLAVIGVFPGLMLFGQALSFPGMIGIVALAGVVVNSAILLIDTINERRLNGEDKETAIIEGSKSRLRPIFMTTITTIVGMIPLTMSSPTWSPIAYAMISGLMFSSILTLAIIPLLYRRFAEEKLGTVY